jgi:hypothetical protein
MLSSDSEVEINFVYSNIQYSYHEINMTLFLHLLKKSFHLQNTVISYRYRHCMPTNANDASGIILPVPVSSDLDWNIGTGRNMADIPGVKIVNHVRCSPSPSRGVQIRDNWISTGSLPSLTPFPLQKR